MTRPLAALAALCVTLAALPARADDYPSRPITLIVPAAAGGATDVLARIVAEPLRKALGQPVVVENKAGGGGVLGMQYVAKTRPDGYTIAMGNIGPNAINVAIQKNLTYSNKSFVAIGRVAVMPNIVVTQPDRPINSIKELIDYAKANPGKVDFASSGVGQSIHMSGELFKVMAGVDMVHVPYKGSGPAVQDLLGGQVTLMFDNLASSMPHVKSGKLKALAVTSAERWPAAKDIPTVAESGVPGFEVTAWFGLMAPAGTPQPIIDRLNTELGKILADPAIVERLQGLGAQASPTTPQAFSSYIDAETAKWADVVKKANVQPE